MGSSPFIILYAFRDKKRFKNLMFFSGLPFLVVLLFSWTWVLPFLFFVFALFFSALIYL
jgi:hypothetical protein